MLLFMAFYYEENIEKIEGINKKTVKMNTGLQC